MAGRKATGVGLIVMVFLNGTKDEAASEDDLAKVAVGCGTSETCGNYCSYNCYYTEAGNGLGYCP